MVSKFQRWVKRPWLLLPEPPLWLRVVVWLLLLRALWVLVG